MSTTPEILFDFPSILSKKPLPQNKDLCIASLSDIQLADCANDLLEFRTTGLLKSTSILRAIGPWMDEVKGLDKFYAKNLNVVETVVTCEILRRFVNQITQGTKEFTLLKVNQEVWYADSVMNCNHETPEHGHIYSVYYLDGQEKPDTFSVEFDEDFDEFEGDALGDCIFTSLEDLYKKYPGCKIK